MTAKIRKSVARELLDVLIKKQTPDIIENDCVLRKQYATDNNPWPFKDVEDACFYFQEVVASNKKYLGVKVSKDGNILRLRYDSTQSNLFS